MKLAKEILETQLQNMKITKFYRFQLFIQKNDQKNNKKNTVGMAYLKEGQGIYTLRLWTLLDDKYFLIPNRDDASKYFIMTREANKSRESKNKYFWNIVGNAVTDSAKSVIELNFDLLDKKIFMSIFPEESATPYGQPVPDSSLEAA